VSWSLVVGIGLALGVGILAYIELQRHLFEQCAVRLRAQARPVIDRRMEHLLGQIQLPELAAILAMDLTNRDTTAILVDPSGEVVAAGPPHEGPVPPVLPPGQYRATFDGDPEVTYIIRRPRTSRLLVALIPPRLWLPHPPAIVQLTTDLGAEERLLRWFAMVVGVGLLLVMVIGEALQAAFGDPYELLGLLVVPLILVLGRLGPRRLNIRALDFDSVASDSATGPRGDFTAAMRRMEAAYLAQQAQEQQMRRFLTDSSHELRTPLASLGAAADVLLGGAKADPAHVERMAQVIRTQADRMERLVEDLFTLARLDSGQPLRRELLPLSRLAAGGAEELTLAAGDRRIELRCDEEPLVLGDPDRLGQVLANLTSNAVRHTSPDGRICLDVSTQNGWGILRVTDDGDGIPPEELPRIFERFYRADPARSSDGFGLGLAIVREIVEAHGGAVEAESNPAEGTTFRVLLPLASAASPD